MQVRKVINLVQTCPNWPKIVRIGLNYSKSVDFTFLMHLFIYFVKFQVSISNQILPVPWKKMAPNILLTLLKTKFLILWLPSIGVWNMLPMLPLQFSELIKSLWLKGPAGPNPGAAETGLWMTEKIIKILISLFRFLSHINFTNDSFLINKVINASPYHHICNKAQW